LLFLEKVSINEVVDCACKGFAYKLLTYFRGARPEEVLKEIAISLSKKYPLRQLSRELGISVSSLKSWTRENKSDSVSFLELKPPPSSGSQIQIADGHLTIEFYRPVGGVMKISGKLSGEQLHAVTKAFVYGLKNVLEDIE